MQHSIPSMTGREHDCGTKRKLAPCKLATKCNRDMYREGEYAHGIVWNVLYSELIHHALHELLQEQDGDQTPEELPAEACEALDVAARVQGCQDQEHDSCPHADPGSPRQKVLCAQSLLALAKAIPAWRIGLGAVHAEGCLHMAGCYLTARTGCRAPKRTCTRTRG